MGLDMYLIRKIYVAGEYEHRKVTGGVTINIGDPPMKIELDAKEVHEISVRHAYWRKANQIHRWFVEHVQDGEDKCQESYVDREELIELRELCRKAIASHDATLLYPMGGSFFGDTDIDEWYWKDLEETVKVLSVLPKGWDYYYQASW